VTTLFLQAPEAVGAACASSTFLDPQLGGLTPTDGIELSQEPTSLKSLLTVGNLKTCMEKISTALAEALHKSVRKAQFMFLVGMCVKIMLDEFHSYLQPTVTVVKSALHCPLSNRQQRQS